MLLTLALLSCLCLSGLAGAAMLVMRTQAQQERVRQRLASLESQARQRPRPVPMVNVSRKVQAERTLMQTLLGQFGVDPGRTAHLPLRWFWLLLIALLAARIVDIVVSMVVGPWGILAWPVLWIFLSRATFSFFNRRHSLALFRQFPDALALIVRAVRIGIPVSQAVQAVASEAPQPTAGVFRGLADSLIIGKSLDEAMLEMAERNGLAEYRFFAAALSLQSQTGGGLAATLENLADVIRKRVHARARGYALAAEARMSALVLTVLPIFAFLMLVVTSPAYVMLLLTDRMGHMIFGAAIGLLVSGQYVMRLMIRKSLS